MKPIRTETDYRLAIDRIDELAVLPDAEQNDELEILSILVEAYESAHMADRPMDPVTYLQASMANRGLTQADLAKLFGSSARAAEILNGKRQLSKTMIRILAEQWGMDANTLIGVERNAA